MPVDLSALGDESHVSLRRLPGDSEGICLSFGKAVSAWVSADEGSCSASAFPASSARIKMKRRARSRRLQLRESWECLVPSVKLRCGLKAIQPDVSPLVRCPNA